MPRKKTGGPKPPSKSTPASSILAKVMAAAAAMEADATIQKLEEDGYLVPVPDPEKEPAVLDSTALALRERAYIRLGVTAEEVEAYPTVTESFKDLGGVTGVIEYFRASEDKTAREIVRLYDLYKHEQTKQVVPFEAYCVAAKVSKKKLLQVLMGEVCEQSDTVSTLLAASAHPDIVKKTIAVAKSDEWGSIEARNVLHKHRGFTPTPKTQQVTIHGNVNQDNRQDNSKNILIPIGNLSLDTDRINRAVDRFNEARIVRSETTDNDAADAEFVESEA